MAVTDTQRTEAPETGAQPCLIVDNVDVIYRVYGTRRQATANDDGTKPGLIRRAFGKTNGYIGAGSQIHAVKGVSFVANHGESIGIVGRNGSGKSTLLRAIGGLLPVANGSVYVSGQTALLGVNAVLMRDLTGEQNIMIGGLALGLSKAEIRAQFDEIVEFSGIGDFAYVPMQAYSSGMGARLRFAISTAARPDILMIDEALATGDAQFKQRSKARIDDIRQHAGTIFFVSHSLKAVREMCTRVLWLDRGELRMDGPTDEVCDAYQEFVKSGNAAAKTGTNQPSKAKKQKKE